MTIEKNGFTATVENNELTISTKYGTFCMHRCEPSSKVTEKYAKKVLDDFIEQHSVRAASSDTCVKMIIRQSNTFQQVQAIYSEKDKRFDLQFYDDEFILFAEYPTACRYPYEVKELIRKDYPAVKGLTVGIFRDPSMGDCTNGGISAEKHELYLISPGGSSEPDDLRDCVSLEHTPIGDKEFLYAKPLICSNRQYSAGGNFVFSSNSLYQSITGIPYPISIHDRYEGKKDSSRTMASMTAF